MEWCSVVRCVVKTRQRAALHVMFCGKLLCHTAGVISDIGCSALYPWLAHQYGLWVEFGVCTLDVQVLQGSTRAVHTTNAYVHV